MVFFFTLKGFFFKKIVKPHMFKNLKREIATLGKRDFISMIWYLLVNGVEIVKFASRPCGGYLSRGMATVGVSTNWVPGGNTRRFSCVIQRNLLLRWWWLWCKCWETSSASQKWPVPKQFHNEIMAKIWDHILEARWLYCPGKLLISSKPVVAGVYYY